jgi:drug/metabolite transporter (DMT)-like permease
LANPSLAAVLALVSTFGYGAAFVLTQFGLRFVPPWLGAAISIPTSTLMFWCLAPFSIDLAKADMGAAVLFAGIGVFFPAAVTLLNFESNRVMGPNIAGAVGGLAPVFAVLVALVLLGETLRVGQLLGMAAIVGGVMLMYRGRGRVAAAWSFGMLALPVSGAAIRGLVQPVVKFGLERWPSPMAAVVLGYTVSAAVLVAAALVRNGGFPRHVDRRGVLWFAAVGVSNGLAVLSMYAALGRGPVTLVSPLVASYPLITVLLSHALLKDQPVGAQLLVAVAVTVGGVILLITT